MTEWFSWRQSDTAAVGRFLERNDFNFLKPQYYDLSNIQSSLDNPDGLRLVEFPIYNALFAYSHELFPQLSLEVHARLFSIFFSLVIIVALFWLIEAEFGLWEAFFAGLFFALNPYVIFYSRTILPDMPATALATLGIYFAYRYLHKGGWLILAGLCWALALLMKPTVIFFLILPLYFIWRKPNPVLKKFRDSVFLLLVAGLPLFIWRQYIHQFPEGIPFNQWLFTSVNTSEGLQSVFFKPAFFRWIFFERIASLILGGYLVFFLIFGLFFTQKKNFKLEWWFLIASLLYLFTFQGGNVQHEYYQIMITPTLSLIIGVGMGSFLRQKKVSYLFVRILTVLVLITFSFFFSAYSVRDYYKEQPSLLLIADVVRSLTNENDQIVTDTMGDTTLLYLSDRRGYPAPYKEFPELQAMGAKYFVTQNLEYKEKLAGTYPLVFENNQFLIFAL